MITVIFSAITEKQCVKERYPHSTAKIRLVQHCAAISAIAEMALCALYASRCAYELRTTMRGKTHIL